MVKWVGRPASAAAVPSARVRTPSPPFSLSPSLSLLSRPLRPVRRSRARLLCRCSATWIVTCQTGEILLARRATAKAGEIFRRGRTRTYFVKPFFPFRVAICLRIAEKSSPYPSLHLGLLSVPYPIIRSLVVDWWYAKAHDVNGTTATAKSARQEYKRGKSPLDG